MFFGVGFGGCFYAPWALVSVLTLAGLMGREMPYPDVGGGQFGASPKKGSQGVLKGAPKG